MSDRDEARATRSTLDVGTSYDFFVSLYVLHLPKKFGLRGAWASGMLARLSAESRDVLSRAQNVLPSPVHLLPGLPEPKNVETLLWHLAQLPPTDRIRRLACPWNLQQCGCPSLLEEVAARGSWTEADRRQLRESLQRGNGAEKPSDGEKVEGMLDLWADATTFGEAYLSALRNYYDVFFREEERRIRPAIEAAAERVSDRSRRLPLPDLIEEISSGLRFDDLSEVDELVLAPSFWLTPFTLRTRLDERRMLFVFGARSANDSIVPGETVPDGLIRALKALSDPTRLRILRLVADRSMGAAELARALRLRTPTMLHHLHALRLAGLIQIRVPEADTKKKALFSMRPNVAQDVLASLVDFLREKDDEDHRADDAKRASEGGSP